MSILPPCAGPSPSSVAFLTTLARTIALKPIVHEAIRNAMRSDRHRPVHARWLDMRIEDIQEMGPLIQQVDACSRIQRSCVAG
jgi:hypothetical protein